ncbi:MAG TPA: metallophosphoesterase [Bacilli bacterium]|nr:metallophosphoesterase [Bacilli bacterium]
MGMIFKLEHANIISNLIDGKVDGILQYLTVEDKYYDFISFLDNFDESIFTNRRETYLNIVNRLRDTLRQVKFSDIEQNIDFSINKENEEVYHLLFEMSKILGRFKYRFLILDPDYSNNKREILNKLKHVMYQDAIYLWPEDIDRKSISLLNVFPGIEKAINSRDKWPLVLAWEKDRFGCDNKKKMHLIKIDNTYEIFDIANSISRYGSEGLKYYSIRHTIESEKRINHYIIQISDLHFGNGNSIIKNDSMIKELKSKIKQFEENANITLLITGDCIDTPNIGYLEAYNDFYNSIRKHVNTIYSLPGNHDLKISGLVTSTDSDLIEKIYTTIYKEKIVHLNDDVVLLLFDSNKESSGFTGMISNEQMDEFDVELLKIKDLSKKRIIVSLHHHVVVTPDLKWRKEGWFKKFKDNKIRLNDSNIFMNWLKKYNVKLVLNGHNHQPYLNDDNTRSFPILSCGSTGGHTKMFGMNYKCYNIIKLDDDKMLIGLYAVNNTYDYLNIIESHIVY